MSTQRQALPVIKALTATLLLPCSMATFGAGAKLPDGPGVNLVYSHCQTCHSLQYVEEAQGLMPAQWDSLIASMQDYGLEISDDDKAKLLKYLKTYLGPNPPPETEASAHESVADNGAELFKQNCAACHGPKGLGQAGYFPPLANNTDLSASRMFPVLVVLNGLSGSITVDGQDYDGSMPALDHLSDDKIAAIINYVRDTWGDDSQKAIAADEVAEQRKHKLAPQDVHAKRQALLE